MSRGKTSSNNDMINLYDLWMSLWDKRYFILGFTSIVIVITIIISLFMTKIYMARTTVFPVSSKQNVMNIGDINNLGFSPYTAIEYDTNKIMAILKSRTLRVNVIKKLKLFGIKNNHDLEDIGKIYKANDKLNVITFISHDKKSGIITLMIYNEDPVLARDIANTYISELNNLLNSSSILAGAKKIEFLEEQIQEIEKKLQEEKRELVRFQRKTKIIEPVDKNKWTMGLYSKLISRKSELELKLSSLETALAPDSPEIISIKKQLASINSEISKIEKDSNVGALPSLKNAPDKISQYDELSRKVKLTETIYETLTTLYEETRFHQAHESPYVQVIDYAVTPHVRSKPNRREMVIVAALVSLFFSVFTVLIIKWMKSLKENGH